MMMRLVAEGTFSGSLSRSTLERLPLIFTPPAERGPRVWTIGAAVKRRDRVHAVFMPLDDARERQAPTLRKFLLVGDVERPRKTHDPIDVVTRIGRDHHGDFLVIRLQLRRF